MLLGTTLTVEAVSTSVARPTDVVVAERTRDLRTSIVASMGLGDEVTAVAGAGGIVTAVTIVAGSEVVDGTPLLAVDGVPILAHRGTVPFFRPIASGVAGADVVELQGFLTRIGFAGVTSTGTFDRATASAVRAFQKSIGVAEDGVFSPGYVAFLPMATGAVESVDVRVGDAIDAGATVATFVRPVLAVRLVAADEDRDLRQFADLPVRVLAGDVEIELGGVTPRADELPALAEILSQGLASGILSAEDSGDERTIRGLLLALRDPVRVGAIPAEAVYAGESGVLCVFVSDGTRGIDARPIGTEVGTSTEIGVAYVDAGLVGESVVALPTRLPADVVARCG
jgi:peptidoglycan hydrolase-like protein with peptidoglycan-binding domain